MATKNARFWTYHRDSLVKITLRPGESVALVTGGATEEGYCHRWEEYTHNGDVVSLETAVHARDCDGPMESYRSLEANIDELAAHEGFTHYDFIGPGMLFPRWREVGSCQRDHYAESMNY